MYTLYIDGNPKIIKSHEYTFPEFIFYDVTQYLNLLFIKMEGNYYIPQEKDRKVLKSWWTNRTPSRNYNCLKI